VIKLDKIDKYIELEMVVEKVKVYKEKNGLALEDIAEAVGVNRSHIHRILKLEVFPSTQTLLKLLRFIGTPLSDLLHSEGKRIPTTIIFDDEKLDNMKDLLFEMGLGDKEIKNSIEFIKTFKT
jgi:transcriptional regulator with XRE-family HTH domain